MAKLGVPHSETTRRFPTGHRQEARAPQLRRNGQGVKRRVLVCGDRNWLDVGPIRKDLLDLGDQIEILVDGAAKGADTIGYIVGHDDLGLSNDRLRRFHADWSKYHQAAGPIRNREMLKFLREAPPDVIPLVFAYHNNLMESRGTADMYVIADDAGIEVRLFPEQEFDKKLWLQMKKVRSKSYEKKTS